MIQSSYASSGWGAARLDMLDASWSNTAAAWVALIATVALSTATSIHAVLHKRDVRGTIGWFVVIWLATPIGAVLYLLLGVNRIRRAGRMMRSSIRRQIGPSGPTAATSRTPKNLPADHLRELLQLVDHVEAKRIVDGNRVELLLNGEEAYPAMLSAIKQATKSLSLASYIFEADKAGLQFVGALEDAVARGVEVRVLVDAAGANYGRPRIDRVLKRRGVPVALFNKGLFLAHMNLRLHRKILVADGHVGFTGGMNIRHGHLVEDSPRSPIADCHFRVCGPVVEHLQQIFVEDWEFTTGEVLDGQRWFPSIAPRGPVLARGLSDGPDEDFNKMHWTLSGALSCAEHSVKIMTPYFLPDAMLINILNLTAMRGVQVDILIPARTNIVLAQWAAMAQLPQVLNHGCRVFCGLGAFTHSKLLVVDGTWVLVGSGNWDTRSLRLNFECNLECYDVDFARAIDAYFVSQCRNSRSVTQGDVDRLSLLVRIRNGLARMLLPYL